jgi:hypothetical protein
MSFMQNIMGSMLGDWRAPFLELRAKLLGGAIRFSITPNDQARGRWIALWIDGKWTGQNYFVPVNGDIVGILPINFGADFSSIIATEVGDAATFTTFIPSDMAEYEDALSARRIRLAWTPAYRVTPVDGDAQLTAITISGAQRGVNCAAVEDLPTRGRLYYTITTIATTHVVRWWNGSQLVAEGSIVGNGAIAFTARNGSGLTIAATLTYTAEVKPNAAFLDMRWPKQYQIHYSTAALTYPRTPEVTMNDNNADSFIYISPVLAAGSYNYNVLQVDDDGVVQTTITAPADSPLVVHSVPAAPVVTGASGTAAAGLTLTWTVGEAGCTYTLYYGKPNQPINFDAGSLPAPIVTALNATSATTPAITGYTAVDNTADYNTMLAAIDAAVTALNAGFVTAPTGFAALLTTQITAIKAAIDVYSTALGKSLVDFKFSLDDQVAVLNAAMTNVSGASTSDWQVFVGSEYGSLLSFLSSLGVGNAGRYTLPNGQLPGGADPSGATATGEGTDGSTGTLSGVLAINLLTAGQPFVKPGIVRMVVRATKAAQEEHGDAVTDVTITNAGAIQPTRPNAASIQAISNIALAGTVSIAVIEDNTATVAVSVSVKVDGATANTVALPAAVTNTHKVDVPVTFGATGWHVIEVFSTDAAGSTSLLSTAMNFYVDNTPGVAVASLSAKVIRGR